MRTRDAKHILRSTIVLLMAVGAPLASAGPGFTEWSTATNLGDPLNSAFNETGPALSRDGLSLYFTSDRPGGFGGNDIWVAQRDSLEDPWRAPANLGPVVNTAFNDAVPAFSRDGHLMFFNSNRPGGFGNADIWVASRVHKRDDFGWETPINAGPGVNGAAADAAATFLETGEGTALLFFGSDRNGAPGLFDIYVSEGDADGSWSPAVLVPDLSSPLSDQRPSIRFDGLEMFLYSNRAGTSGPSGIWVSTRSTPGEPWSTPFGLDTAVNSAFTDIQAFIGADRTTLVFASDRPGGSGRFDLYVSTRVRQGGSGGE